MIKGQNWSNANYPLKQTKNNQILTEFDLALVLLVLLVELRVLWNLTLLLQTTCLISGVLQNYVALNLFSLLFLQELCFCAFLKLVFQK